VHPVGGVADGVAAALEEHAVELGDVDVVLDEEQVHRGVAGGLGGGRGRDRHGGGGRGPVAPRPRRGGVLERPGLGPGGDLAEAGGGTLLDRCGRELCGGLDRPSGDPVGGDRGLADLGGGAERGGGVDRGERGGGLGDRVGQDHRRGGGGAPRHRSGHGGSHRDGGRLRGGLDLRRRGGDAVLRHRDRRGGGGGGSRGGRDGRRGGVEITLGGAQ